MISEHEAMELARGWFNDALADWIRLERADFGWIARVEEPPIGPGDLIGQPLLALGPTVTDVRDYPPMPSPQVRQQHLAWLEAAARTPENIDGSESFI
jgi:hypothetical protein